MKIQPLSSIKTIAKSLTIETANKMIKDIKSEMIKANKYNFEVSGIDAKLGKHNEVFAIIYAYFHSVTFEMWRQRMQAKTPKDLIKSKGFYI